VFNKKAKYIYIIIIILFSLIFLFPLIWMFNISFKETHDVYNNPFGLPRVWMFSNYPAAIKSFPFILYFMNSIIYSIGTIVLTLLTGGMLAYCIARMKWKLKNTALTYIALGMIVPVQVVIVPIFLMLRKLHISNTYFALILPYVAFALPGCVLMMYAFFRTLPAELEEAACIDGCGVYRTYFRIIFPMVKPVIATQVALLFMFAWNEFFLAFILTTKMALRPISLGLFQFFISIGGFMQWGVIGAAMVMTSLPSIIIYLFFSEQIENALTAGAILK